MGKEWEIKTSDDLKDHKMRRQNVGNVLRDLMNEVKIMRTCVNSIMREFVAV